LSSSYVFCPRPPVLVNQCLCHCVCQKGCLSLPSRVGSLDSTSWAFSIMKCLCQTVVPTSANSVTGLPFTSVSGGFPRPHLLGFLHHEVSVPTCRANVSCLFPCPSVCFGVGSKVQALSASKVSLSGPRPPEGASARVSPNLDTACGSMATRARLSCSLTCPIWGFHPKCSCITFCLSTP